LIFDHLSRLAGVPLIEISRETPEDPIWHNKWPKVPIYTV
jgi:hypothetical protein